MNLFYKEEKYFVITNNFALIIFRYLLSFYTRLRDFDKKRVKFIFFILVNFIALEKIFFK